MACSSSPLMPEGKARLTADRNACRDRREFLRSACAVHGFADESLRLRHAGFHAHRRRDRLAASGRYCRSGGRSDLHSSLSGGGSPRHACHRNGGLAHLDKTGWVLLTDDAAHFKDNWDNDRVPSMNTDAEQTHSSHARLARIIAEKKAALWINHDLLTFDSLKHSPDF